MTTGVANATKYFSLATNVSCFPLIEILSLATKSKDLGTSRPDDFFPESQALKCTSSGQELIITHCIS